MQVETLGRTGMTVTRLCLGTAMLGGVFNDDHQACGRIIDRALDAGVTFVDTADVYSYGESEEIVGRALRGRRDQVVLATKSGQPMSDDPRHRGGSRRWIIHEVESSLRRLDTDWIDLYQLHRPDPSADIDETLGALTDLIHAGKLRYIGHSTFPAHAIVEAQWVARDRHRERFVSEQPPYSILVRKIEADVLPICEQYGLGVLTWGPLNAGWLSGRYRVGREPPPLSTRGDLMHPRFDLTHVDNQRKLDAVERLAALAEGAGMTLIDLAVAFVLAHPAVTSVIAGPRTMEQLECYLRASEFTLDDGILDAIDEIVAPGTNLLDWDDGWRPPAVLDPSLRRRGSTASRRVTA